MTLIEFKNFNPDYVILNDTRFFQNYGWALREIYKIRKWRIITSIYVWDGVQYMVSCRDKCYFTRVLLISSSSINIYMYIL